MYYSHLAGGDGLLFLGFIILSNALKGDTVSTIKALTEADIHCNMITGDHAHTVSIILGNKIKIKVFIKVVDDIMVVSIENSYIFNTIELNR